MLYSVAWNDKAAFAGDPQTFPRVSLGAMGAKLGIVNTNLHAAHGLTPLLKLPSLVSAPTVSNSHS